ncbi:hypothetical protein PSTT_02472 [Puccinia striiformis]|uniref:Uncharacterized protein n=1 Tax=Puccinia striiformis TaxID=27350 RepID=A0A2S4VZL1_9BASI|nr:hypothetical protein PSTT_02472 [Puccinia striiformis]
MKSGCRRVQRPSQQYDPYSDSLNDRRRTRVHRENADISRPELEKVIFNRLHSSLVPLLGQQIADLSRSLDPTHFQNYSVFAFQLILEVQSKLHQTLNQIESAIETICAHRKTNRSRRVNDQNLQHFKLFRLDGLCKNYTEGLMPEVVDFFKESRRLINILKIPKKVTESRKDLKSARQCIINRTSSIMVRINTHIEWYNGPEFDLVQLEWPKETHRIDDSLGELLSLINQAKYNSSVTQAARLISTIIQTIPTVLQSNIETRDEPKTSPVVHKSAYRPIGLAGRVAWKSGFLSYTSSRIFERIRYPISPC